MAQLLGVVKLGMDVMSIVTFAQFIEEEAIQACQLGVFMALRARNYKAARQALLTTEETLLPHLKDMNTIAGWLAPYSQRSFEDFIIATEASIAAQWMLVEQAAKGKG